MRPFISSSEEFIYLREIEVDEEIRREIKERDEFLNKEFDCVTSRNKSSIVPCDAPFISSNNIGQDHNHS